jgi:ribosomal protein S18 acetylase RimI-like enzyme
MEILQQNTLTQNQTEQVKRLQQICMDFDRQGRELFLGNDINYHKEMPGFFLGYQNGALIGVLVVFAPTMDTAEISAYVHPDYRRIGVFSSLLMQARTVLKHYSVTSALVVTDAAGTVCREILSKWQAAPAHSEYLLVYHSGEKKATFPFADRCNVREATSADLSTMVELNMAGFGEDLENASHMVRENFNHELTRCFVGLIDKEIFGLVNVRKEGSDYYICGFNIAPVYRGSGMGRYLLYQVLHILTPADGERITLEVDSTNHPAYMLYITSGFDVQSQADYYLLKPDVS